MAPKTLKSAVLMEEQNTNKVIEAIEDIALSLMNEDDVERLRKGVDLIHTLAHYKSMELAEDEIAEFNASAPSEEA